MSELTPHPLPRRLARPLLVAAMLAASVLGAGLVTSGGGRAEAAAPATSVPSPTVTAPNPSPFPPSAPTNVTATTVRTTSITLTWTASTPGCCAVTGYDILYQRAFNDVYSTTSVGNVTTVTLTSDVRPAAEYRIWVYAHDGLGHQSPSSSRLVVVTPASDTASDTTPPSAPGNLTAAEVTGSTVALSWSPSTDNVGVTGYDVYYFDGVFRSVLLATVTGTSYAAPLVTGDNRLYVRSRDAAGNDSIASNVLDVTGPSTGPTGHPTESPTTNPTPSPTARPSCRVSYSLLAQWSGGFVAGLTITNTGATRLTAVGADLHLRWRPADHLVLERHVQPERRRCHSAQRGLERHRPAGRQCLARYAGHLELQPRRPQWVRAERRGLHRRLIR